MTGMFNTTIEFNENIDSLEVKRVRASLLLNTLFIDLDSPKHFAVFLMSEYGDMYLFEYKSENKYCCKDAFLYRLIIRNDVYNEFARPYMEYLPNFVRLNIEKHVALELESQINNHMGECTQNETRNNQ